MFFSHRNDQKPGYRHQVSVRIFWPILRYVFKNSAIYIYIYIYIYISSKIYENRHMGLTWRPLSNPWRVSSGTELDNETKQDRPESWLSPAFCANIHVHFEVCFQKFGYIYIYIYTRFQKGFHMERYIDRYILLFSCTCARVHFSLVIVQHVKNLVFMRNFLYRVLCFTNAVWICSFVWKMPLPCSTDLWWRIIWLVLGMRKPAREVAELLGVTQMSWHL